MAKVKTQKHDTWIDMTAMSDVTVLLLTFFMLTANFIPLEPVSVVAPYSVLETKVPEYNVATILVDRQGRIFLNLDKPEDKVNVLDRMGRAYGVSFSDGEKQAFAEATTFAGVPMGLMKAYLDSGGQSEQKAFLEEHKGIPADSTNNQLAVWIKTAREVNKELSISVKADKDTPYPLIKNVTGTLQQIKENRFSLVTQLRGMPEGF